MDRLTSQIAGPVHRVQTAYRRDKEAADYWFAVQISTSDARAEHRRLRDAAVDTASAGLGKLAADGELERQFAKAIEEIEDHQLVRALVDLAILIGLSLVTGQIAAAVGSVARGVYLARSAQGALLAERAAGMIGLATEIVVDTGLSTGAQRAISDGATGNSFAGDLFANAATLLALRPFAALHGQNDSLDTAAELTWVKRGKRLALEGTVASLEVVSAATLGFATQAAQQGGAASAGQQAAWIEQAGTIALAKSYTGQFLAPLLRRDRDRKKSRGGGSPRRAAAAAPP